MADEYIRRDTALRAVTRRYGACRSPAQNRLLDEIRNEIRRVPSADVTEVVQGQWEGEGDGYADGEIVLDVWYCSQCGYCIDDGTDNPDCLPKHCPGCGAKMDGGGNDEKSV